MSLARGGGLRGTGGCLQARLQPPAALALPILGRMSQEWHKPDHGEIAEVAMSTINVSLTPYLRRWIDAQVVGGRYGSTSEVVRAALRLLEDAERGREVRLRDPRAAIDEGDASGDAVPFDLDHIIAVGQALRAPDPAR